jgi:hypothetical protein
MYSIEMVDCIGSSIPIRGEIEFMQMYVIKFVSYLKKICNFVRAVFLVPPPIKLTYTIYLKILLNMEWNKHNSNQFSHLSTFRLVINFMKRKFTNQCSTNPPILTKWPITSHLKLLNTKVPRDMVLEIRRNDVIGLNRFFGSHPFDNCIIIM